MIIIMKYLYDDNRMSLNFRDGRHSVVKRKRNGMNVVVQGSKIKNAFIRNQKYIIVDK